MPVQDFSRVIVEPVHGLVDARLGDLAEVRFLGEVPAYHLVLLLIAAALETAVRVAIIDMGPMLPMGPPGALHPPTVRELRAVVNSDTLEYIHKFARADAPLQPVQCGHDAGSGMIWHASLFRSA